ncbi:MAPEG family protein [Sphingopyxis sp.]|uniref:MAPEG family protein n=1 Tax=Sphingopyxis sp. TaxID=1908224 RepID=UPI002ED9500F
MAPRDLARAQRGVALGVFAAVAFATLIVTAAWVSGDRWLPRVDDLAARLVLALRLDLAVLLCLAVAIGRVAGQRFRSAEDIGGSVSPSESAAVRRSRAILRNTLEQVVLAVPAHLALASVLPPDRMAILAALVALFVAGRIAFAIGYPYGAAGRAFGFGLTFFPTIGALVAAAALAL